MPKPIRVRQSCDRSWIQMAGTSARRFCEDCHKTVYNLDALTEAEIKQLREAGDFCATYIGDAAGNFRGPSRLRSALRLPKPVGAATTLLTSLAGCSETADPSSSNPTELNRPQDVEIDIAPESRVDPMDLLDLERHKSDEDGSGQPLTQEEIELLRCIGYSH